MRPGDRFPFDQAYIHFNDAFIESLEPLTQKQRLDILSEIAALSANPGGNHTLSNKGDQKLAGWNMVDVLQKQWRVVFESRLDEDGVGHVEVLVAGPRRDNAIYAMADRLIKTGRLTSEEITEIWEALALLDTLAKDVGLDGWDYKPEPGPEGMAKAAVASGLLDEDTATALSQDELTAAMAAGWGEDGKPDPAKALMAALRRARASITGFNAPEIVAQRATERCSAYTARTKKKCIRRKGHPGPHRGS